MHRKKKRAAFSDVRKLEVVVVVGGILCPIQGLTGSSWLALSSLLLWQRARQEPEGNAGDEEEGGGHHEAHPPGAHPARVSGADVHFV